MTNKIIILALIGTSLLSACSNRIYFTDDTKLQLERSKVEMDKIQFYNSQPIVLARQIKKEEVEVVSGKVKLEKGKYIEEIVINRYTPGVFIEKNEKVLFVSFEEGDGKYLPFMKIKSRHSSDPVLYQLGSLEWKTNRSGSKIGIVNYEGNKYSIVAGGNSRLLISKSELNKVEKNTRIAKGRKIN